MADFEEKLSAILGNSDAMGQIASLAKALTADKAAPASADVTEDATYVPVEGDKEETVPNPLSAFGDLDPRIVQTAMALFSEYSATDDRKVALLTALKPFVKETRYAKVDKAVQIAKLSRVIRVALRLFQKEGDGDV